MFTSPNFPLRLGELLAANTWRIQTVAAYFVIQWYRVSISSPKGRNRGIARKYQPKQNWNPKGWTPNSAVSYLGLVRKSYELRSYMTSPSSSFLAAPLLSHQHPVSTSFLDRHPTILVSSTSWGLYCNLSFTFPVSHSSFTPPCGWVKSVILCLASSGLKIHNARLYDFPQLASFIVTITVTW